MKKIRIISFIMVLIFSITIDINVNQIIAQNNTKSTWGWGYWVVNPDGTNTFWCGWGGLERCRISYPGNGFEDAE